LLPISQYIKLVDREFFIIQEFEWITYEEMLELEYHHFVIPDDLKDLCNDHPIFKGWDFWAS
jgi:hypothetical protein